MRPIGWCQNLFRLVSFQIPCGNDHLNWLIFWEVYWREHQLESKLSKCPTSNHSSTWLCSKLHFRCFLCRVPERWRLFACQQVGWKHQGVSDISKMAMGYGSKPRTPNEPQKAFKKDYSGVVIIPRKVPLVLTHCQMFRENHGLLML